MFKRIRELFDRGPNQHAETMVVSNSSEVLSEQRIADDVLSQNSELQQVRLELGERDYLIRTLKGDLERMRNTEKERVAELLQAQMQKLMSDFAAPLTQIATQTYLFEVEKKPLQSKDVLAVAKRMVKVLEGEGLTLLGGVNEIVPFDENYHQPLTSQVKLQHGERVVVRLAGASFAGRVLRKASVEKASN